jgi:hypothetical protein
MLWYTRFSQTRLTHATGNTTDTTLDLTRATSLDWFYIKNDGSIVLDFQTSALANATFGGTNSTPSPPTTFPVRSFYDDQATTWAINLCGTGVINFSTQPVWNFGARPVVLNQAQNGTGRPANAQTNTVSNITGNANQFSQSIYYPNMTGGGPGLIPFAPALGWDISWSQITAGVTASGTPYCDLTAAQLCSRG